MTRKPKTTTITAEEAARAFARPPLILTIEYKHDELLRPFFSRTSLLTKPDVEVMGRKQQRRRRKRVR